MDYTANLTSYPEVRFGTVQNWCQLNNSNIRRASRQVSSDPPPVVNYMSHLSDWFGTNQDNISKFIPTNNLNSTSLSPEFANSLISSLLPSRPPGITLKLSAQVNDPSPSFTTTLKSHTAGYEEPTLEALDERWQIYLIILYSVTAVASFILNVLTVLVLIRGHKCMLRRYIINLSLSDLLMSLLSIPFTYTEYMLGRWIFPNFLCPVVRFAVLLSVFVSAATMSVIGINRYSAIMHPTKKSRQQIKIRHWRLGEVHFITFIWIVGIAISTPEYLMHSHEPFCFGEKLYYACSTTWPGYISLTYSLFVYLCTFAIPVLLLLYVYTRMGLKLWRHQTPGNADATRDITIQTTKIKVIKMFFVVVAVFVISWSPIQTFYVVSLLMPDIRQNIGFKTFVYNIYVGAYFAFHWLSMFHSCLNPLIYCFMSGKFRRDLYGLTLRRQNRELCFSRYSATYGRNNNSCQPSPKQDYNYRRTGGSASPSLAGSALSRAIQLDRTNGLQLSSSYPGGANCGASLKHLDPLDDKSFHSRANGRGSYPVQVEHGEASGNKSEILHHSLGLYCATQVTPTTTLSLKRDFGQVTESVKVQFDKLDGTKDQQQLEVSNSQKQRADQRDLEDGGEDEDEDDGEDGFGSGSGLEYEDSDYFRSSSASTTKVARV